MAKKLRPGDKAPDISLPDQYGREGRLSELRGKWVLVYFYPRDDTPGCTLEACGLRDAAGGYARLGIEVLGISADTVKSHEKFARKHDLSFRLLADVEKQAIRAYGAWGRKKFMGREFDGILRQSFLVDPAGKIAKVYPKVKPEPHAAEVLADVQSLAQAGAAPATRSRPKAAGKKTSNKTRKSVRRARG